MDEPEQNFVIRELDSGRGWVIDVVREDGATEQLVGVYTTPGHARLWLAKHLDHLKPRRG
jgi:hypothetical protein